MGRAATPIKERIYPFLITDGNGCMFRKDLKPSGNGYVQIMLPGRTRVAVHRLMYEWEVGPIPEGMTLDHLCHTRDRSCNDGNHCRHRACCNPAHLEAVTPTVNAQRGRQSHGRGPDAQCRRGHKMDEENTLVSASGRRRCRACKRLAEHAYYQRKLSVAAREEFWATGLRR